MRTAYLIDKPALGGGNEYIRRKGGTDVFYACDGTCTASHLNALGFDEIVVNHLRALVQLYRNPFVRPHARVTFIVHGLHLRKFDFLPKTPVNRLKRALRRALESCLYHKVDRILTLTPSDQAAVKRIYGADLDVAVEPNSLAGWVPNLAKELPNGLKGPFRYLVIGRFEFPKGQDLWIREIGRRKKEKGEVGKTLFIGDGVTRRACERLAASLGVADLCVFAGAIPEADRYLKCADVVVGPSRWEGMPYLMMKARALGCRVLATPCAGNVDVLDGYDKWERLEML